MDPFSGRGTTAMQALLMERRVVASDVNELAFCLTRAKTAAPPLARLRRRISQLESQFDGRRWERDAREQKEFFHLAFQSQTLQQLLFLRSVLQWRTYNVDAMVAALVLGSLHGEMDKSSSYLSNQMPRTIATKPSYSVKFWSKRGLKPPKRDVFKILRNRSSFRYESEPPVGEAVVLHMDMRELPWRRTTLPNRILCAVTSPPYFDVTNFEEDQWLRLWFLGGPPHPTHGRISHDDRYTSEEKYWAFIADMWRSLGTVLAPKAHVVIRIGSSKIDVDRLQHCLTAASKFARRPIERLSAEVSRLPRRQTDAFRPGSKGCSVEVDCHYHFKT